MTEQSKDLIIGAYTNYTWDQIKYWVNSIEQSGFTGDKLVIVYNSDYATVQKLLDRNFKVLGFNKNPQTGDFFWPGTLNIVVERFYHLWWYLSQLTDDAYRFVITTDVKDVVFQRNPSVWLENHCNDKQIVASCESLHYEDEPWGADNMSGSYPMLWPRMKSKPIWNCGVQAGRIIALRDLWLSIWLLSKAAQRHNPDQAAYNYLLDNVCWNNITLKTMSEDGWACQAGTTVDPKKISAFLPKLLEPGPLWNGQTSTTNNGTVHTILHQWDRIPDWKNIIQVKYG
jgi:hypothetical protein